MTCWPIDAPKWASGGLTLRVPFDYVQGRPFGFAQGKRDRQGKQGRPLGCVSLDAAPFSFAQGKPFGFAQGKPFGFAQGKRDRQGKQGRRFSLALDSPAPVLA